MTPKPLACPHCGSRLSLVKDSGDPLVRQRAWKGWSGEGLWRLRQCQGCQKFYTTEENVTGAYPQAQGSTS